MRWLRVINLTWENLQIATHKSVRWTERTPSWFVLCDLQILVQCTNYFSAWYNNREVYLKIRIIVTWSNRQFTRQPDPRLLPGCYGNLIVNVKCGQSWPKRAWKVDPDRHDWATFTFTIIREVRSCCTEMTEESLRFVAFLKHTGRVFSFDIVQSDSFLC